MKYSDLFIAEKLPPVLSDEELLDCFDKMKNGDMNAREKIIVNNIRFVIYMAKKFSNTPYDMRELVSIGMVGLIKSVDEFDPSKGIKFCTFSSSCITNEILMFIRQSKKYINDKSLDESFNIDYEGKKINYLDFLSDDNVDIILQYEEAELSTIIKKVVDELEDKEKTIIFKYFGFGGNRRLRQHEIAKELGVSQSYFSRILKKILNKIRIRLKELGIIEPSFSNEKRRAKRSTIYDYFGKYTKDQVDSMLSELTDEERQLVSLRFGKDLNNSTVSNGWNETLYSQYYGKLVPKMEKILNDLVCSFESVNRNVKTEEKVEPLDESHLLIHGKTSISSKTDDDLKNNSNPNNDEKIENSNLTKEDYVEVTKMLKDEKFGKLLNILTLNEAVIFCLKFGYVNDKKFTSETIAKFMGIELDEVNDIVRESNDKVIESTTGDKKTKKLIMQNKV